MLFYEMMSIFSSGTMHSYTMRACQYEYAHQNMQRLFSTFDIQTKKIISHIFCMPLV